MAMDPQPYFSIVIPTYNRAAILAESLKGILQQTFQSYEVLIVDDGSTDHTQATVEEFTDSRIKYFKTENRERSHARNYGAMHARGLYVNYFDSDDVMYPDRLRVAYDFINAHAEPTVFFTHYDFVNERNEKIGRMERHFKSFTKDILFNNFLAANSVFIKREIALLFPFHDDRRLITAEDWELWLRVHSVYDFLESSQSTFAIRQHEGRSLATIPAARVMERDTYFAFQVDHNPSLHKKFGTAAVRLFKADRFTFIALTWVQEGKKRLATKFLFRAFTTSLRVLIRRRFWAVLKKLI